MLKKTSGVWGQAPNKHRPIGVKKSKIFDRSLDNNKDRRSGISLAAVPDGLHRTANHRHRIISG